VIVTEFAHDQEHDITGIKPDGNVGALAPCYTQADPRATAGDTKQWGPCAGVAEFIHGVASFCEANKHAVSVKERQTKKVPHHGSCS